MTSSLWSYQLTSRTPGEPQGRQFLADLLRDLHRVAVGLFVDVEQDRRLPVLDDAHPLRHAAILHRGDIADPHDAGGIGLDDDIAHLPRGDHAVIGDDEREAPPVLHLADRAQHIAVADRVGEVAHRQRVIGEAPGIGQNLHFGGLSALDIDPREAFDGRKQRRDLIARQILQGDRIAIARDQRIGDDREDRRVHAPHVIGRARRQRGQDTGNRRIDEQRAGDHVAAPAKVDGDLRRSPAGFRADIAHAGNGADRFLDRAGDGERGLAGRAAPRVEIDDHARERDLREEAGRQ
jgi:hypothetical protein